MALNATDAVGGVSVGLSDQQRAAPPAPPNFREFKFIPAATGFLMVGLLSGGAYVAEVDPNKNPVQVRLKARGQQAEPWREMTAAERGDLATFLEKQTERDPAWAQATAKRLRTAVWASAPASAPDAFQR